MADDNGFISLPPGLVDPDSGTHRRPRPERTERIPADEIVFVPVVPGAPPVVPVVAESSDETEEPGDAASVEAPDLADNDETRIVPPRTLPRAWRLTVPGIEGPVMVEGALFLGRNPSSTAEFPDAELLVVPDPSKSISKTHALLEVDNDGLWVHDLDSTNGVWVVLPGESPSEVVPGTRAALAPGADLELGDVTIQVEFS